MRHPALVRRDRFAEMPDPTVAVPPLGLGMLLATVRQNLFLIAAATLGALALAVAVLVTIPPRYQSQVSLVVSKSQPARPVDGPAATSPTDVSEQSISSLLDEITTASAVREVIAKLHLDADPEFNPGLSKTSPAPGSLMATVNSVIDPIASRISGFLYPGVTERGGLEVLDNVTRAIGASVKAASHTIIVSATSTDPEKSAAIANTLVSTFLKNRLEAQKARTVRFEQWLGDRLNELRLDVRRQEDAVELVRSQIGHYQGQTSSILSEQLSQLSRELLETKAQLANAEAKHGQLKLMSNGNQQFSLDDVLNSVVIQNLRQQEAQLLSQRAAALSQFGEKHPDMMGLHRQVNEVRQKIATEISRVDQKIAEQVRVLGDKAAALEAAQQSLQGRIEVQNGALVRLRELQNDADSNRATFQAFSIYRAKVAEAPPAEQTDVSVVSAATPALKPASPNRKAVLAFVGLAAFFVSVIAVVLRRTYAQDLRSAEQISTLLGLPTLALIPKAGSRRAIDRAVVAQPGSALSESIRYLFTSIEGRSARDSSCFRVLISSAVPDEGKTTTALLVAREAALAGVDTLLLNLDLRRRVLKTSESGPFGIHIEKEADTGLHVLDVNPGSHRSFTLLHQPAFWRQIEELSSQYKLMIIDSPPVLSVSDAAVIARFAHSTIFIVRWGKTRLPAVIEALRQLRSANANIDGVVLTQVDVKKHAMYGYGDSGVYAGAHKKYYLTGSQKR